MSLHPVNARVSFQIKTLCLAWLVSSVMAHAQQTSPANRRTRPNVVIFLTDDQGWGDLSIHGNRNLTTPHIDSLARDGVTLQNFYVCAVCAPTRAEFLTGRYHPRTGVSGVSRGEGRLNFDETTVADLFQAAGYTTGAFGKWHNGTQSPYHPNDRGFDQFYGFTSGHWGHYFSPPLDHNGTMVRGNGYVVDDFTDHALKFIEANRHRPFFCYLPYNTPHSPMMVDDTFYDKFKNVDPEMRHHQPQREDLMMTRAALAMCENIDWNVGRVLQQLDRLQLRDNTIVLFFSDNGPNSWRWNGGMKGRKGSIDEGGLRSPFFLRWPGHVTARAQVEQVTAAVDLLPTLTDLVDIPTTTSKPIDGQSFAGLLTGNGSDWQPRQLYSIWKNRVSVRTQQFRLDDAGRLYDIRNDRGQRIDVAGKHPKLAARLRQAAADFQAEMNKHFAANRDRPFTVGYSQATRLPARDGIPHGTIQRSAKAPNNSFFKNWTDEGDSITWSVHVRQAGTYTAIVHYTCSEENVGATIRLAMDGTDRFTVAPVATAFDPPLYDKSKERVANSHYFVKDFRPLVLGTLDLPAGKALLRLSAPEIVGRQAIDVHSIELIRSEEK